MKPFTEVWKKTESIELVQVHPQEMEPLYSHCFEFETPVIVEIGSAHGASSTILAEAASQLKGDLFCIDNFVEGYEGQEKFGDYAYKAFKRNVLERYGKTVTLIHMDSTDALEKIIKDYGPMKSLIDVLFIDGDHTYEGVQKDCQLYLPLLRSGGYVGFHDYNNVAFSGVKKAADEFTAEWPTESVWNLVIRRKP